MRLDKMELNQTGRITSIDWTRLDTTEAHRFHDLGFEEGAEIEPLHRGWLLFRDPLAVRIGRMTVAIRSAHAAAVEVELA